MISHQHKCIFIHIPKCAGTSIEKALGHYDLYDGRRKQDHRSLRMLEKPLSISSFTSSDNLYEYLRSINNIIKSHPNPKNKLTVSKEQYKSYYKFSIVRNPWDRVYSWYKNVLRDQKHMEVLNLPSNISFKDFLLGNLGKDKLRPQTYWLKNYKGNVDMDFIGKFENLALDFSNIAEVLNLGSQNLPHELKSSSGVYTEFYNDELKDIVWKFYKEEIKLFDYEF